MNIVDATIKAQSNQTENLIKTAGREIRLIRPQALVDDGAGGKKRLTGGADRKLQPKRRYFGGLTTEGRGATTRPAEWMTTSLGEKYKLYYILIGLPDDDIQVDDYFYLRDEKYVVLWRHGDVDQYQAKFTIGLER